MGDAFGVQHVHLIVKREEYKSDARVANMNTAMGSCKWLTLHVHDSATECAAHLKALGYRMVMSDLHGPPVPQSVPWSSGPVAVVIGNELKGASDEMRTLC